MFALAYSYSASECTLLLTFNQASGVVVELKIFLYTYLSPRCSQIAKLSMKQVCVCAEVYTFPQAGIMLPTL